MYILFSKYQVYFYKIQCKPQLFAVNMTCSPTKTIYFQYVYPTMTILLALTMIIPMYRYLKHYLRHAYCSILFWSGFLLFILIFCTYVCFAISDFNMCQIQSVHRIWGQIGTCIYVIQNGIFLGILFLRLYTIFQNSVFYLNRSTITSFAVIYILGIVLGIFGGLVWATIIDLGVVFAVILAAALLLLFLFTTIWIVVLYVKKLIQVYKTTQESLKIDNGDDNFVETITKTSILCFISTSTIIWRMITFALLLVFGSSPHYYLIFQIVFYSELHTNFLCIFLSYTAFDDWYKIMCGCCHNRCTLLWTKSFRDAKDSIKRIESTIRSDQSARSEDTLPYDSDETIGTGMVFEP